MEILLKAGKTLKVDDESYTMMDEYSGIQTHVFTSKETRTIYTIKDEDIAGFGEKWLADRGFIEKKAGRPTKAAVEAEKKRQALSGFLPDTDKFLPDR